MASDWCWMSATELIEHYQRRDCSPLEVTQAVFDQIESVNPLLNAFVTVTPEEALRAAVDAEHAYRDGTAGRLAGVPLSLKDLTATDGVRTTRGSKLSADWVPDFDAPFAARVKAAGAVLVGKTNTPEYGWKGESSNLIAPPSRNPWGLDRTPGGSSGGGAAAVAAGMAPLAQGSDGAGSIRIPASFCGIVGLKPTFGLVPQFPASIVSDLAHIGPMTRTVADAALLTDVTAGPDPLDRFSWPAGFSFSDPPIEPIEFDDLRIAFSPDLGYGPVEPEVVEIVAEAVRTLESLGASIDQTDPGLPDPWDIVDTVWSTAMAGMHLDNLESVRDDIDPGRLEVVEHGLSLTAAQLANAQIRRNGYFDGMRRFFDRYDLLLTPTLPCDPFPVGQHHPETIAGVPVSYLGWTVFTYPFNATGMPAITVPVGFSLEGFPVGMQIIAPRLQDRRVLEMARLVEEAMPWRDMRPPVS